MQEEKNTSKIWIWMSWWSELLLIGGHLHYPLVQDPVFTDFECLHCMYSTYNCFLFSSLYRNLLVSEADSFFHSYVTAEISSTTLDFSFLNKTLDFSFLNKHEQRAEKFQYFTILWNYSCQTTIKCKHTAFFYSIFL